MLIKKLPLIIGIELLILAASFVIAKDVSEITGIYFVLSVFVLIGVVSVYLFKRR